MYIVSTTQRCGSTWLTHLLTKSVRQAASGLGGGETSSLPGGRYVDALTLGFPLHQQTPELSIRRIALQLSQYGGGMVIKTHDVAAKDFARIAAQLPSVRLLTITRDFKDVVFYSRYYCASQPRLGRVDSPAAETLARISELPDAEAIRRLLDTPLLQTWCREWAAFETPLTTSRALRVSYDAMLDRSAWPVLQEFTGMLMVTPEPLRIQQLKETAKTGREGKERFHRHGTSGQWRNWFAPDEAARLDALAMDHLRILSERSAGPDFA